MSEDEAAKVGHGPEKAAPLRIGLVATDDLRVVGLQVIVATAPFQEAVFGGRRGAEIVPLSVPGVLQDAGLSVVMIDASCTEHLLELLTMFRRSRPQIRIIVLGDSTEMEYIQEVIGAGAKGYLTHEAKVSEIQMALEIVSDGSIWAPRKVLSKLLDASNQVQDGALVTHFTSRELEVLRFLVTGMGNREIAMELRIDEGTVKAHLSRLMRKVGVKNRIELSIKALRYDIQSVPGPRDVI